MSEEKDPLLSYNFDFAGGDFNSYLFITQKGVLYEIRFKPTPYLFGKDFPVADEIVELVIKIADNPTGRRPPLDTLIPPTVAAIINDFYQKSSLTVTIFICDTVDRRHEARWRKFNRWYNHFEAQDYIRIDDGFRDDQQKLIVHCAVILKKNNPYLREVSLAFFALTASYNTDK